MAALAALGLASGIVSALATYSLNSNAADYLAGLLLGITLGAALYAWGAPPAKCLLGAALAGLAWIVVLWGFEHTLHDRSLFRSKGASSTASWFADWPGPKPAAWKMPTTKPLSADDMRIALESDIKDGPKGYDNFQAVSPDLKQHYSELQTLSSAYIDLFRSIKRMLFGILGSVVVFCAFATPFPWLRRARTIGLAAAAGAAAALVLGTTTLSGSKTSLSGWAYQIPWQASLGAVVGYAVVHYVPDMPWVGRTLFPKPSSWKPIAWMMLGGALAGIVSAIVLFNMFPDTADAATAMRLREWDTATSMRGLALAVPGALVLIAGFLIFGRASWVAGLVLTVSLLVAWVAAYGIELGGKKFGLDMSKVVVVTFISLAGAAVVEPRLRQPGVWIVALLATIATGAFHYLLLETHVLETLFFGPEPDKNVFDALLYVTLNMCVGAAIGYGLGLGRDPNPPRS
jgi:hypothetical protein